MREKKITNAPNRVRNETIKFRVTKDELERINKRAESSLSREGYLRELALKGKVIIPPPSIDRQALMQINKIGVNINQIVKKINESDVNVFSRAIKLALLKEIAPLEKLLEEKVNGLYNKIHKR